MKFDPELWRRARPLFDELVTLEDERRRARLDELSATDPTLASGVARLLLADSAADAALERYDFSPPIEPRTARTESPDPLGVVGRTVSHFDVTRYLAAGGMGAVYEAVDLRLGRAVALKFPLPRQQLDESAKQRLLQEARSTAALDHPNLCTVHEVGESPFGVFIAMPLYAGETLKARLERERTLPIGEAIRITREVAVGISSAHASGIVHRDLKPGNIMLLPDRSVKVLDFGLAKVRDVTLSRSQATIGTIAYMAPDQIRGERADGRADLWALGVMLHQMLAGVLPFRADNEIAVIHAVLHDEPPMPSTLRPGIPPELDDIVHRLLRKNPARRYQTAPALLEALDDAGAGDRAGLRRAFAARRRRLQRRLRSRSGLVAAGAVLVVAAAAAIARGTTNVAVDPIRLAVLPFAPMRNASSGGYLAVGMSDAVTRDLARLRGVVAPSSRAMARYRGGGATIARVASEQQATVVLRGSIGRAGGRVRVDAELLDGRAGTRLWSRRFDRPSNDLVGLQRDVEDAVVGALRIRTSRAERDALGRAPTADARAYDLYLQARAIELSDYPENTGMPDDSVRKVLSLYSQARWLDPRFASARARLAQAHMLAAATYDTTAARRDNARLEAEAALRLRPDLPEVHEALASYWNAREPARGNWSLCLVPRWCGTGSADDQSRAIRELRLAIERSPHDPELHLAVGAVFETAGRRDEATAEYEQAARLDAGNPDVFLLLGLDYSFVRRHEEAVRAFSRVVALAPERHDVKILKGFKYLRWTGSTDTLAAVMRTVPAAWDPDGLGTYARFTALWVQRRYADGLAMLARSTSTFSRDGLLCEPTSLMRARLHEALGHRAEARAAYDTARSILEDSARARPDDPSIHVSLGVALAGLGRADDAVREAKRAMELAPMGRGDGAAPISAGAVQVFAKAGRIDAALELLELLFTMPAGRDVTVPFVRAWPAFDPLRGDPGFERLLVRYGAQRG
ncbi:MAG TPA: protein kinase [Gemmatimonadaceae bacterium]|jgi:non-specific serine/threonine protein kinase|nr:protein kinase [Gemmatimonadaceae bacterium]